MIAGIGQGFVLTTPIQLAVMAARIGNGRKAVKAKLLSEHAKNSDEFQSLNISGTVLKEIQRSMRSVVAGGRGTARNYDLKGYGMAGKKQVLFKSKESLKQREMKVL